MSDGRRWRLRWPARWLPPGIGGRLLLLTALALLPMLLLLAWVYAQRYQTRRVQAEQTELEVAEGVATAFSAFVTDVRRTELVTGAAILGDDRDRLAQANRLLTTAADQYTSITNMNWVSPEGRILASNVPASIGIDLSDRPYVQAVQAGAPWVISDLLPVGRVTGRPTFTVAQGIRDDAGQLRGIVVAGIDPTRLGDVALTQARRSGGGFTVFDRQGTLVHRSPEVSLTWEQRTQWRDSDAVLRRTLQTRQSQTGEESLAVVGGNWVVARVPITGLGWVAGAGRPVDDALAPVRRGLVQDSALALLVTVLAVVLAQAIARTIAQPLRRLQADVRAFGEGETAHRAAVAGPTEVAQVAAGFNHMAGEIAEFQETLEARVRQRTAELEASNRELESFSYTVAHDLRSPLRAMDGYSRYLLEHQAARLDTRGAEYLARIRAAAQRMGRLIDDLLMLARVGRAPLVLTRVDLGAVAAGAIADLRAREPDRQVEVTLAPDLHATGDADLLRVVMEHLLGNAWKFTSTRANARIAVGMMDAEGRRVYAVQDNGVGFDMTYANQLFQPFHRLHTEAEFPGTGIGLALVQRIIARHGGRVWAEGAEGQGATVYFTLGA